MDSKGDVMAEPVEVTDASFAAEVVGSRLPVLLDCWAPWCGPCRMVAPVIDELARDLEGTVKVAKLNVDENPRTAGQLGIQSIPTLLLFDKGKVIGEMVGAGPRARIEAALLGRLGDR